SDVTLQLTLKRASTSRPSGEWNDDDFDVLADGVVVGRIMKGRQCRWGSPGCGRSPSDIMRSARRRTPTRRPARPPWLLSAGAGGGSSLSWTRTTYIFPRQRTSDHTPSRLQD